MDAVQSASSRRAPAVWAGLIFIVVLLAAAALWKSARSSQAMSTAAASDETQFAQTSPGTNLKVVLEVADVSVDGTLQGRLLQKKTEESYTRTSTKVTARITDRTAFVMGKRDDLKGNVVVHVGGEVRDDRSIDAEQIVILTGYVHVE